MSRNISRRTFLKASGALAAVGMAGMLSGCDLMGSVAVAIFPTVGDAAGMATDTAGRVMYTLGNVDTRWWTNSSNELTLIAVKFQVKNMEDHEVTLRASDFKSVKIDDYNAQVVVQPDARNYKDIEKYPGLFDAEGKKVYKSSNNMEETAENGYLYFAPVYTENGTKIKERWSKVEMSFSFNGKDTTFVMTMDDEKHVSSYRK